MPRDVMERVLDMTEHQVGVFERIVCAPSSECACASTGYIWVSRGC